jgi:nucleoside-diphosphate-sugar epimerase
MSKPGFRTTSKSTAVVTGSSGLCGARLVEMLLERGAKSVIAVDITPPDTVLQERFDRAQKSFGGKITVLSGKNGDITSDEALENAFSMEQVDVCYHIAALVGPFYDRDLYHAINHYATKAIIQKCIDHKVKKLVYSSSPSTRFTGADVDGLTEDQLPMPTSWLAMYAEAKAFGEMAVSEASDRLLTVSVAPHQVYGPYDSLFLPNLLETAGNGRLRIFGKGLNRISVTYVDNYCHGLICGSDALEEGKKAACLGKFYIVTGMLFEN